MRYILPFGTAGKPAGFSDPEIRRFLGILHRSIARIRGKPRRVFIKLSRGFTRFLTEDQEGVSMKRVAFLLLLFAIVGCTSAVSPAPSVEQVPNDSHMMPSGEVMEHESHETAVITPVIQEVKEATATPATGDVKEFFVEAYQFAYDPSEIKVKKGDTVRIHLHTRDVGHSLNLRDLNINIMANPGADGVREFVADTAGNFAWRCTLPCGSGHKDMKGMLIVE